MRSPRPEARAAVRRVFYPQASADSLSLLVDCDEGYQEVVELDVALHTLLLVLCRKHILPWYGKLTSDRAFFHEMVSALRPVVHVVQQRTGAVDLAYVAPTAVLGVEHARVRVVDMVVGRSPRVLLQHLRQFRSATDALPKEGLPVNETAERYMLLSPHHGIVDDALDDAYLRATITALLESIQRDVPEGDPSFAPLEVVLVRDVLVFAMGAILTQVSRPQFLCMVMHSILDKAQSAYEARMVRRAAYPDHVDDVYSPAFRTQHGPSLSQARVEMDAVWRNTSMAAHKTEAHNSHGFRAPRAAEGPRDVTYHGPLFLDHGNAPALSAAHWGPAACPFALSLHPMFAMARPVRCLANAAKSHGVPTERCTIIPQPRHRSMR